ncbi:hypothetical protein SAMD00019534_032250 [Acytostelium subglobosum LB1]|uniref:hypothetical protein n=1 Tax=Acytostelium subglobosum LB1 TaxID=1410327 RepID=UPI000644A7EF|nr:hypothetical protein SAMD00019534_032250 [Acytostelium subglobosum LB1]GAM20050.1 hypothetical protein SAMD00019534_032250 [Acytostelium subglobosum LB1]|eukprot:XP_012756812.1 hypothetical protein SAMD00019534_032250 [Acytostelium subglobosum LB1]
MRSLNEPRASSQVAEFGIFFSFEGDSTTSARIAAKKDEVELENCLTNAGISCRLGGSRYQLNIFPESSYGAIDGDPVTSITLIKQPAIESFNGDMPFTGTITGFFDVLATDVYQFRLKAFNIGANLYINNLLLSSAMFVQEEIDTVVEMQIFQSSAANYFKVEFASNSPSQAERNISLMFKSSTDPEFREIESFVSQLICNDGILDPLEADPKSSFYCSEDLNFIRPDHI